jgi:hypothetical protein
MFLCLAEEIYHGLLLRAASLFLRYSLFLSIAENQTRMGLFAVCLLGSSHVETLGFVENIVKKIRSVWKLDPTRSIARSCSRN